MIPRFAAKIPKLLFREKIPTMENAIPTDCKECPTNISGEYTVDVPPGLPITVNLRPVIAGYLSRIYQNVDLVNTSILDVNFPRLAAGDFNGDNIINSLDFSYMNGRWNQNDSLADINRDNSVNSLDFAYLSNNWLSTGE